jgi:hypothetical protein
VDWVDETAARAQPTQWARTIESNSNGKILSQAATDGALVRLMIQ